MNKINLRPALASMDDDQDILFAVIAAFIEEVPTLMNQLDQALTTNNRAEAERASHTLKGNFRILQLQNQQTVWENIEKLAHEDELAQIPELVPEAKLISQQVVEQLKSTLDSRQL